MQIRAIDKFRMKLGADEPVYGLWVTLESASITEMAVSLGLDWVVIDAEHGHLDWRDILAHIRAAVRSDTVVLVRVAELNASLIKRVLDIGADGVVVPWVETPQQLEQAVAYAHYPPTGLRGIGAERATCWGQCFVEHVNEAEDHIMVVPIIETVQSGHNIHQMLSVPGVELFFFGPADYSSTAGYPGQWEGPGVAEAILAAKDAIRSQGKHCGIVTTGTDNLKLRHEQGFRMLGLGLDGGLFLKSLHQALDGVGRDRKIQTGFTLENDLSALESPAVCAPESLRPDRPEVMTPVGSGSISEIGSGVRFECLVGAHNQAKNLTTGMVTFAPNATLPYHHHPFGESITLLNGEVVVEVEGRRYKLDVLDNVTIPRGLAHQVVNTSVREVAEFHVMMASSAPARTLTDRFYSKRSMPQQSTGELKGERVTRFKTAERYQPGPNASFIDFFNRELIPGIEMSGGYGIFEHGGRLPAHVHDYDESICIIQGVATCVVEGREYSMSDRATALQPRGRVHYFINHVYTPMAMLWVYAGPMPERLVVDERCATVDGNPWR